MKVVVTGSTGLVGEALVAALTAGGHTVARLVRTSPDPARQRFAWDPATGSIDTAAFDHAHAVVHLAGENIAAGRWTEAHKARIRDSRIKGTRTLCGVLSDLDAPPKVLVSASAIGYYGDRGEEVLTEASPPGTGFLPEVCVAWEAETEAAAGCGIRVVLPRIGVVLSPDGGALAKMLTPFKMGTGGVLGSGKQFMSWIDLDDLVAIILHALTDETLSGPVNAVAPEPATNRVFTKTLGKVLRRPTIFPMPAFAARTAFGEMADALLLASTRVQPAILTAAGFTYQHGDIEACLRHQLDR